MTDYELAMVRLRAFELLKGYGTVRDDKFYAHGFDTLKELALDLADWAACEPEKTP